MIEPPCEPVRVLLIGGRSGSGKTSVAYEISAQLEDLEIAHCHVEGDNLDAAYPKAAEDAQGTLLTERNLAALWANYAAIGHHRLLYVNTVSVLEPDLIVRAVGGRARVTSVLLTASDEAVFLRLATRESGSRLQWHLDRSRTKAALLDEQAPPGTRRVATDGRTVADIAAEVIHITGWRH